MSEEILVEMSRKIGELTGVVKTSMDSQAKTNEALFKLAEGHEKRLTDVEGAKNKIIGAAIISSVGGSGIGAALMKMFGIHGAG